MKTFGAERGNLLYVETNTFDVTLQGDCYDLRVTNKGKPWWARFIYDGKKSYYFTSVAVLNATRITSYERIRVEISDRPSAVISYKVFEVEFPWLMYCLSPMVLSPGEKHESARPFVGLRNDPESLYGWRWEIRWMGCGRFPAFLRKVRDTALDLDWRGELSRDEIDLPQTIDDWNRFFMYLDGRRWASNGHVQLEYKCLRVLSTNGLDVPVEGLFKLYDHPRVPNRVYLFPWMIVEVVAESVGLGAVPDIFIPDVSDAFVQVRDYRYRRMQGDRIFNYARYTLKPGEPFRSANDPELLAQAERALRRGRKYYEPPVSGKHKVLWVVAVVLAVPPVVYLLYRWRSGGSVRG